MSNFWLNVRRTLILTCMLICTAAVVVFCGVSAYASWVGLAMIGAV